MDLSEKDKFGLEKSSGDNLNYHTPRMSSEWRFDGGNLVNPQLGMVPTENSKGDQMGPSACSSVSMGDSFCPNLWDHPPSQNLGFCENNVQTSTSTSNIEALRKSAPGSSRSPMEKELDMGWNPSMSKGGLFLQTGLPQSLSQFPTDSAFIERAARYSCFNGGNFVDMVSSFTDMVNPFSTVGGGIQAPEVSTGNSFKAVSGAQSQKNESHMAELVNDVSLSIDHGGTEGSPMKTDREAGNLLRLSEEGKRGMGVSSNESDEAEFSGGGGQEEPSFLENAAKELSAKKRKRSNQEIDLEQSKGTPQFSVDTAKENTETKHKGEQNTPPATTRPTGKHAKDSSQNSDVPKEDYIHVRARRGQATNSHSLAERVRRERISERMKFLQDLVPGCSKVTGKAVMLDEIINYVQSLQRQVEFLSMKLATVNPRMEFNLEGLLSKDILQSRGGTPSTIGFSPDMSMPHPHLHQSQSGLIQAGIPGIGNPPDSLRRAITSQLTAMNGYREPAPQMPPGVWDDELHNVVQMSFGPNAPFNTQELTGSLPPGHMKVEL